MSSSTRHLSHAPTRPEPTWKALLESAAIEVFEIMAGARLEPIVNTGDEPQGDRTAMVGLAGALCGMMTIRCSGESAAKLASRMLDGDAAENPQTACDALGELCNMVAGNFKSKVSSLADHCMLSVPTVIRGEDYVMQPVNFNEALTLALSFDGAPLWVSLVVHV